VEWLVSQLQLARVEVRRAGQTLHIPAHHAFLGERESPLGNIFGGTALQRCLTKIPSETFVPWVATRKQSGIVASRSWRASVGWISAAFLQQVEISGLNAVSWSIRFTKARVRVPLAWLADLADAIVKPVGLLKASRW
jgi:hypothetical protein